MSNRTLEGDESHLTELREVDIGLEVVAASGACKRVCQ